MGSSNSGNNGHAIATAKFFNSILSACITAMTTINFTTEEARAVWALLVGCLAERGSGDITAPVFLNGEAAREKIEAALNAQ